MDKLRQELSSLHIEKALDIATRDGAFAKEMYAGFGSCKEIVALDRSDKMFEKGREKCAGMPVNFVIGDACHMDFEDNTFDVVVKPGGLIILSEMYNDGQPKASLTHWILHDIDCTMHTIDGIYHHPTYSKSEILWLARNAGLTVEKTLCDLIDDPKVVAKLRERIAAVPGNLKKYENDPAHAFLAAEAAWLNEEYEANGVTSAEQLVAFCRK